jgi:hypothetical protein
LIVVKSIASELAKRSGHDFQGYFAIVLGELVDGSAETKRLGYLDRLGVDAFLVDGDEDAISTAIQCKGFEVVEYGDDQHRQCRAEIAKYQAKGPKAARYWFAINRPIKDRALRAELEGDLGQLVSSGKVAEAELLDRSLLMKRLEELAMARLSSWAEARRAELFEFYRARMEIVRHIDDVPFNGGSRDPAAFLTRRLTTFFEGIAEHQTGKYRHAPKFLVTSEFGFGKTTTLQTLAQGWIDASRHLVYAPAALLDGQVFTNASGLAASLLQLILPDDSDLSAAALLMFRGVLRDLLTRSKDWLLVIDGLDENAYAFQPNSLARLWGCIADLGIPAVLSARDILVETRPSDFHRNDRLKTGPEFERITLDNWEDSLILRFVDSFAASRGGDAPEGYRLLRELIASGRYDDMYGDIPKRPLFLGMLVEDAWSGKEPERNLHRLYGAYFRHKFDIDRISPAARGMQGRPSEIADRFGNDEAKEMLIRVMQEAADHMLEVSELAGPRAAIHRDTIPEGALREFSARLGIPFVRIEDVAMHSLLQPAGRDPKTRERLLRFAHRSFQDWFVARQFAEQGREAYPGLPAPAFRFLTAMQNDLAAGNGLP